MIICMIWLIVFSYPCKTNLKIWKELQPNLPNPYWPIGIYTNFPPRHEYCNKLALIWIVCWRYSAIVKIDQMRKLWFIMLYDILSWFSWFNLCNELKQPTKEKKESDHKLKRINDKLEKKNHHDLMISPRIYKQKSKHFKMILRLCTSI